MSLVVNDKHTIRPPTRTIDNKIHDKNFTVFEIFVIVILS
jgi:hypothetical protein